MKFSDDEFSTLWVGAFRYYVGRRTIVVDSFCRSLVDRWESLPERAKTIIERELEELFNEDDYMRGEPNRPEFCTLPLGWDCDRESWERVRDLWKNK